MFDLVSVFGAISTKAIKYIDKVVIEAGLLADTEVP